MERPHWRRTVEITAALLVRRFAFQNLQILAQCLEGRFQSGDVTLRELQRGFLTIRHSRNATYQGPQRPFYARGSLRAVARSAVSRRCTAKCSCARWAYISLSVRSKRAKQPFGVVSGVSILPKAADDRLLPAHKRLAERGMTICQL